MLGATMERALFKPHPQSVGEESMYASVHLCVVMLYVLRVSLLYSYLVGVRNKKKGTLTLHKADMYSVKPTLEGDYAFSTGHITFT